MGLFSAHTGLGATGIGGKAGAGRGDLSGQRLAHSDPSSLTPPGKMHVLIECGW